MAKFIVIGDLILDRFIYGDANRISPEAPSILINVTDELVQLGGAYNVVAHLRGLGNYVSYLGATGLEFHEKYLEKNLSLDDFIITDSHLSVIEKTRLVANYKLTHIARFDRESAFDYPQNVQDKLLECMDGLMDDVDGVLLIDYNKGLLTKYFITEIIKICNNKNTDVFVDTKKSDISSFKGAKYLKPNKVEFAKILDHYQLNGDFDIITSFIVKDLKLHGLIITAGPEGMRAVTSGDETLFAPAIPIRINELSGAGDSVLATLAHSLNAGYDLQNALLNATSVAAKFIAEGPSYRARCDDLFFGR